MDLRVGIMDNVNMVGALAIEKIQQTFKGYDTVMHGVTEIGNSAHTFSLLIPVAAAVDMNLASDLIVSATVGEWTSTLLKWLLMEGRPYWWVRETTAYETVGRRPPVLTQTPLTCETGAGSPSGHTMHVAIIGFVLTQWLLPRIDPRARWNADSGVTRYTLGVIYGLLVAMVATSRMFIAAHFPHQCLLGALIGIPLAWCVTNAASPVAAWWRGATQKRLVGVAGGMALAAVAAYWLQRAAGVNPQWSVRLAFKWCSDPKFLHVSTTNVFSLVRDCGTALGFAIAAPRAKRLENRRVPLLVGLLLALLVNVGLSAAQRAVPTSNFVTFYIAHYLLFAAMPVLLVLPSLNNGGAGAGTPSRPGDTAIPPMPGGAGAFFRRSNEAGSGVGVGGAKAAAAASRKAKTPADRASASSSRRTNAHSKID